MDISSLSAFLACHAPPSLALPATDVDVLTQVVDPALALLPAKLSSPEARVMLLAIGRQESGFDHRVQEDGPAHGLWQFEPHGVADVMFNSAATRDVLDLCAERGVRFLSQWIYQALPLDDVLAAGMARLLLWCDPEPLPALGQQALAWNYYLRNWRPGKPGPSRWAAAYQASMAAVRGEP